jgi:hypothetical protein
LRRLGQAGSPVGTLTPGTIGSVKLDGILGENAIGSLAVPPSGCVCANDHTGSLTPARPAVLDERLVAVRADFADGRLTRQMPPVSP